MGLLGIFVATIGLDPIHAHRALHLRRERDDRRHRADPGAGRRVRLRRDPDGDERAASEGGRSTPSTRCCRSIADVLRYWRTILRSGLIGVFIGILPGVGEDMAAWSSYAAAKRASTERDQFGKGSVEGLIAAETGDNAADPRAR